MSDVIVYCSGNQTEMTTTLKNYALTKGFSNNEVNLDSSLKSNLDAIVTSGNRVAAVFIVGQVFSADTLTYIRAALDAGYPIIVSEQSSGVSAPASSVTYNFGLTVSASAETEQNLVSDSIYITSDNAVFSESNGLTAGSVLKFADGASWSFLTTEENLHSSAKMLAKIGNASGLVTCAHVKKGSNTAKITNIGAVLIMAGFFYGSVNTLGCKIFIDLVNLCLSQYETYLISGTVKNINGIALQRTVRLYKRDTGAFVASTTSSVDGKYSFSLTSRGKFYAICLADDADTFRTQIHDKIDV